MKREEREKLEEKKPENRKKLNDTTQLQIEGGGVVQGVTKLISTFSAFFSSSFSLSSRFILFSPFLPVYS